MPVLTCPFQTIPAQNIFNNRVLYPEKTVLSAELAIKPVADETWSIEGISMEFATQYTSSTFVNISKASTALEKSLAFANESQKYLKESLKFVEESLKFVEKKPAELKAQKTTLEFLILKQKTVVEGGTVASEIEHYGTLAQIQALNAELEGVSHEIQSAKHEVENAKHEIEGGKRDIEGIEREINELGRQQAREEVKTAPLILIARVYARGNELVWEQSLTPLRFQSSLEFQEYEPKKTLLLAGRWNEALTLHTQFDDPLDITERENLKLTLELTGPPNPTLIEGGYEGNGIFTNIALSQVQAVVNYSRSMSQ